MISHVWRSAFLACQARLSQGELAARICIASGTKVLGFRTSWSLDLPKSNLYSNARKVGTHCKQPGVQRKGRHEMGDWFPKLTYGELVDQAAATYGDKVYMTFGEQCWSFRQVKDEVNRAARGLMALGIQPGEHVSLWLVNRPEWIFIQFGLAKIGAVLVPINTQFRTADLDYVVRQSDTRTLIVADRSGPVDYIAMIQELCPELATAPQDNLSTATFPELERVVVLSDPSYPGTYR